jgi:FixJ family two-component response regulator
MTNDISLISIVDDDKFARDGTSTLLLSLGYDVLAFASADAFLASGFLDRTSCLISDVRMPGMNGLDLQKRLKESGKCPPIIFITAHFSEKARVQALEAGALGYLRKPFDIHSLVECLTKAMDDKRSRTTAIRSGDKRAVSPSTNQQRR